MDLARLVEAARAGDVDAFTELVRRYQAMAFGYAYATVRDFDLAEDAAQQAFITAWRTLHGLREPARFGGWLRGIVRFECLHLLRARRPTSPLEMAARVPVSGPGPAEAAESREGLDRVLAAIDALPEAERVSAILYYMHDQSQREVAAFLNLPVSTVNNRLRTARARLREGDLLAMANDAFRTHSLPDDFASKVGAVVRAEGPFVEARFPASERPPVLNRVTIDDSPGGRALTAQVAQYLNDDLVRCIVLDGGQAAMPAPGATVRDLEEAATAPLGGAALQQVVDRFVRATPVPDLIETGIKAIDVVCPIPAGGLVALAGDMQVGKMVLVEELIHRLGALPQPVSILVFVEATTEVGAIQQLDYRTSGAVEAVYLPVADASPAALGTVLDQFDTVIGLSRALGKQGLYPAIDPLQSRSRMLAGDVAETVEVLRDLLREAPGSVRASLVRAYLSQPFYVAEPFTQRPGATVPREAAIANLRALMAGEHDDLEPEALYMTGALANR